MPLLGKLASLTWLAPLGNPPLTSYLVFRGTSSTNLMQIQQLGGTILAFIDSNVNAGTYYYGVEAVEKGLTSKMSNIVKVTIR